MALVTSEHYPYLSIRCQVGGWRMQAWALVDSGFDGYLVLPQDVGAQLGPPDHTSQLQQADGSLINASTHVGVIEVLGVASYVGELVVVGDEYIVGQGIISRLRVTLDHGQRLVVEA